MASGKFWGDTDSEEEEEEDQPALDGTKLKQAAPHRSQWVRALESDSDDDDQKRVVRPKKEKKKEELMGKIADLRTVLKNNDWKGALGAFNEMNKKLDEYMKVIVEGPPPLAYIMALAYAKKRLEKAPKQATHTLRGKVEAQAKGYQRDVATHLDATEETLYLALGKKEDEDEDEDEDEEEDEDEGDEDEDEDEDDEDDEDEGTDKPRGGRFFAGSDDDWGSDDDGVAEETSGQTAPAMRASRWLKIAKKDDDTQKVSKKRDRVVRAKKAKEDEGPRDVTKEDEEEVLSREALDRKLKDIVATRGKKGASQQQQIDHLKRLATAATTPAKKLEVLMQIVVCYLDVPLGTLSHMPVSLWKSAFDCMMNVIQILEEHPQLVVQGEDDSMEPAASDSETGEGEDTTVCVAGSLLAFVERLDDELLKSYRFMDPHSQEYLTRLQDEQCFLTLAQRVQAYYERINFLHKAARVAARRIEHIYYRQNVCSEGDERGTEELHELAKQVYASGDDRIKTRAMLCEIFHNALQDRFYEARDMLLMSHLQETIQHSDISTQILFNRAMAQMGLCAFRVGLITDACNCLSEICSGGRVKELLAQGISARHADRNPEQERVERRRLMPFHMHINQELLECIHLISAMLLEIPAMAANPHDVRRRIISRPLYRLLDNAERQPFTGPPETTRDFVVAAARALSVGDWHETAKSLLNLKIWSLVPNSDSIRAMLRRKIQEEGLRTYLFTYASQYDSFKLQKLCDLFELPKSAVHSLVSKMIIHRELAAAWDQPEEALIMHRIDDSHLHFLALQLADKCQTLVETNERMLDRGQGTRDRDRGGDKRDMGFRDDRDRSYGSRLPGYGQRGQARRTLGVPDRNGNGRYGDRRTQGGRS